MPKSATEVSQVQYNTGQEECKVPYDGHLLLKCASILYDQTHPGERKNEKLRQAIHLVEKESVKDTNLPVYVT